MRRSVMNNLKVAVKREDCTNIKNGVGKIERGVYCNGCNGACPYWVTDVDGNMACYMDTYCECVTGRMYGDGE